MATAQKSRLFRLFPHAQPKPFTTQRGPSYNVSAASFVDVPEHDARPMAASGWMIACEVGATAARPTPGPASDLAGFSVEIPSGYKFYDTTLAKMIIWNASRGIWVDQTNTAV